MALLLVSYIIISLLLNELYRDCVLHVFCVPVTTRLVIYNLCQDTGCLLDWKYCCNTVTRLYAAAAAAA